MFSVSLPDMTELQPLFVRSTDAGQPSLTGDRQTDRQPQGSEFTRPHGGESSEDNCRADLTCIFALLLLTPLPHPVAFLPRCKGNIEEM